VGAIERSEKFLTLLPSHVAKSCAQHSLLSGDVWQFGVCGIVHAKNEQEESPIVAQRNAAYHPAWIAVSNVDTFVARTIARRFEGGDDITQFLLEAVLRTADEAANLRMQAIGANN
jgi:hypothetical protein